MEKRKIDWIHIFGLVMLFIVIANINKLTELVSIEFIKNILIVITFASIGIGLVGFSINKNSQFKELRKPLFETSIMMIFSIILSFIYLVDQKTHLIIINWGAFSMIAFLSGILYFLVILLKARFLD